ncbi:thermonuclease family protein [Candidatus Pacearchaeota archaeon]|nr:thermonuclease family protein [Candidatus Pacearchaeota archaeon]
MKTKRVILFITVLILLSIFAYIKHDYIDYPKPNTNYQFENTTLIRVIDGDTIETDIGNIRLLGLNTPEKNKYLYQEAKNYLKKYENQTVQLLRDKTDIDKYNRKLRYLYINNTLINIKIVEYGFATTFMINNLKYKDKLIRAESSAKENNLGLWKKSNNKCTKCITLQELNEKQEYFILQNTCNQTCDLTDWIVKDDANHFFNLEPIKPNKSIIIHSKNNVWNDDKDRFFMRDNNGHLVLFYEYENN